MPVEYRILGPIEAAVDGNPVQLGGRRPRAILALLLLQARRVVSTARLIEEVWPEGPPETADNLVQGYVSELRKGLGRDAIETRHPGYLLRTDPESVDLFLFERLASDGTTMLFEGQASEAAESLRQALNLWRGAALADLATEGILETAAARLDELRLIAFERRIEADLACGRHAELAGDLEVVVAEHPLREPLWALLMLALYRSGRQADALAAFRRARSVLIDELGLEPSPTLQDLQRRILNHDQSLAAPFAPEPAADGPGRCVLVWALAPADTAELIEFAELLTKDGRVELVLATTVSNADGLADATDLLRTHKELLLARGARARAAAFTSATPGTDIARLAVDLDADLVLVSEADVVEEEGLLALLAEAPCDIAIVSAKTPREGPVFVPFTGGEHDWAAVELGARLARSRALPLRLLGATIGASGRDASRLLANASLAAQRALGVDAIPSLVAPAADALLDAVAGAGVVVIGLPNGWRDHGFGETRTVLARSADAPTVLVRRGLRPGGLAPAGAHTQFSWTIERIVD